MKNILIPTDFSECASYATEVAIHIAKKTGAEILFLHSLDAPIGWSQMPLEIEEHYLDLKQQTDRANNQLDEVVQIAQRAGVKTSKSLTFAESLQHAAQTLKDKEQDIIVMGSYGRSGLDKFLLGSLSIKMMRVAKTPVLIIKERPKILQFKTIVFASGLEEDTHEAFGILLKFAKEMEAEHLHFVEVTTPHNFRPTKEITTQMEAFIDPHDFQTLQLHNYNHYNIESGIIEFAQNVNADLIALATHGRSGLSNLFVESIPENLVKHADFPVLSIRV